MTKVLVTGGAGFVGSHVVDRLVAAGYEVTVVDNLSDQIHDEKPDYLNNEVDYVWGDAGDRELMSSLLAEADVLSHQASSVGVSQSMYEVASYVENNSLVTAQILDIVANEPVELEKIVVASSMTVYGEGCYWCPDCERRRTPGMRSPAQLAAGEWELTCPQCETVLNPVATPEDAPLEPNTIYAITKHDQERLVHTIGQAYDVPTVALRYFNIYGSRQSLDNPYAGVGAIFSARIKNGHSPQVYEDGQQSRDFIHVDDIARANQLAIEQEGGNYETINVGTGQQITIKDIAETLIELYDVGDELSPELTGEYRKGDVRHCFADTNKARETIGFEAEIDLEDGLEELVEWGRQRQADDRFAEAEEALKERGLLKE